MRFLLQAAPNAVHFNHFPFPFHSPCLPPDPVCPLSLPHRPLPLHVVLNSQQSRKMDGWSMWRRQHSSLFCMSARACKRVDWEGEKQIWWSVGAALSFHWCRHTLGWTRPSTFTCHNKSFFSENVSIKSENVFLLSQLQTDFYNLEARNPSFLNTVLSGWRTADIPV